MSASSTRLNCTPPQESSHFEKGGNANRQAVKQAGAKCPWSPLFAELGWTICLHREGVIIVKRLLGGKPILLGAKSNPRSAKRLRSMRKLGRPHDSRQDGVFTAPFQRELAPILNLTE